MEHLWTLNRTTLSTRTHLAPKPAQNTLNYVQRSFKVRSGILGSLKSGRGTAYYWIIMWAWESELSTKRSEHLRFRERHCHSAPAIYGTPANIRTNRAFVETRNCPTFCVWKYGSIFVQFLLVEDDFSAKVCFGHSRWSKVIDFGTNRKRVCDFLLVCHSNLGTILHRFGDIAGFCAYDPALFYTRPYLWRCSRWTGSPTLGLMWAGVLIYSAVKLFSKYSNLCDHCTWTSRTGRETDGQATYCGITALCVASPGKNQFLIRTKTPYGQDMTRLLIDNTNEHTRFPLIPTSTTLDHLTQPRRTLFTARCTSA